MSEAERHPKANRSGDADAQAHRKLSSFWNVEFGVRRGDRVILGLARKRRGVKSKGACVCKLVVGQTDPDAGSDVGDEDGVGDLNTWSASGLLREAFLSIGKSVGAGHSCETACSMGDAEGGSILLASTVVA